MPVRLFLDSSALLNLLRLREERFDKEYDQFVKFIKSKKINVYTPSSVIDECDGYIKNLRILTENTLRELRFYVARQTLPYRYLKPQMFLLLEHFFIDKINTAEQREARNHFGIIQQYVLDSFVKALDERVKVPDFLGKTLDEICYEAREIQDRYDDILSEYPPQPVEIIPEIEEIISNTLKLRSKDVQHLAGLCHYAFKEDVWCIFVTTDFTHLLNLSTFNICWVRCVRPRYVPTYIKIYKKIYEKRPNEYIRSSHVTLPKEQKEILKIIEKL